MKLRHVREQLDRIAAEAADDPERAHGTEDGLWESVLKAIADGTAKDPQKLAAAALESRSFEFERWCS